MPMSSQEDRTRKSRLEELEEEINQTYPEPPTNPSPLSPEINGALAQLREWLNKLPPAGRVAVFAIAIILAFSVLNTVLRLVASLMSIAILGILLYLLYKFLIANPSSPEQ